MRELRFRSKEQREQDRAAREVEEREEQRKKKAAEPVNTPGYPWEETIEGMDGQPLIVKHISPARSQVWKNGKLVVSFVKPDLLPKDDPYFKRKRRDE